MADGTDICSGKFLIWTVCSAISSSLKLDSAVRGLNLQLRDLFQYLNINMYVIAVYSPRIRMKETISFGMLFVAFRMVISSKEIVCPVSGSVTNAYDEGSPVA